MPTEQITPLEFWQRFVTLLRNPLGGYASKEEVERTLGIKFTQTKKDSADLTIRLGADHFHSFAGDIPGLGMVKVGMRENAKRISLSLEWGDQLNVLEGCVSIDVISNDLLNLGWNGFEQSSGTHGHHGGWDFIRMTELEIARIVKMKNPNQLIVPGFSDIHIFAIRPQGSQYRKCIKSVSTTLWATSIAQN